MALDRVDGRFTTGPRRGRFTLIISAALAALSTWIAVPAQAHERYVAKAWGVNQSGELGTGTSGPETCGAETKACSSSPVEVTALSGVTAIAGGRIDSFALLQDGGVFAWGGNNRGQLGDGSEEESKVPVAVKELSGVSAISAGVDHTLALLGNGMVMAWGANGSGQLGDGSTANSSAPVIVCAPAPEPCPGSHLSKVEAVAGGGDHSLALLEDGTVVAWGGNASGQLGNGTTTASDVPVAVTGLTGVTAISASREDSLALLASGSIDAWGRNGSGQLGDGTEAASDVPIAVCAVGQKTPCTEDLTGAKAISAGYQHSLALLQSGTIVAWGSNATGQLGDGSRTGPEQCGSPPVNLCAKTPVKVSGLGGASAVAAGGQHSLALLGSGSVVAWGWNEEGQLGDGASTGPEICGLGGPCSVVPVSVRNLADVKGIAAGGEHSLAFGPPPPSVTGLSPMTPRKHGATAVTIGGADFEEATVVKFGAKPAASFKVNSEDSITAVAPSGTGTVDVTVTTPAGTSATTPADRFYYSKPTVKRLSPRKGPELGGTSVTITGTNFTGATSVKFGSTEAKSYEVKSPTSIVAVSPAHTSGRVNLTVSTPNGTSAISGKDRFRYT